MTLLLDYPWICLSMQHMYKPPVLSLSAVSMHDIYVRR